MKIIKSMSQKHNELEDDWERLKPKLNKHIPKPDLRLIRLRVINQKDFQEIGRRFEVTGFKVKQEFIRLVDLIRRKVDKEFADSIKLYNAILTAKENN